MSEEAAAGTQHAHTASGAHVLTAAHMPFTPAIFPLSLLRRLAAASRPKRRGLGRHSRGGARGSVRGRPGCSGPVVLLGADGLPLPPATHTLVPAAGEDVQVCGLADVRACVCVLRRVCVCM